MEALDTALRTVDKAKFAKVADHEQGMMVTDMPRYESGTNVYS